MSPEQPTRGTIALRLTPRQQEEVRLATGKTAEALVLTLEELEERISPGEWSN